MATVFAVLFGVLFGVLAGAIVYALLLIKIAGDNDRMTEFKSIFEPKEDDDLW